MDAPMLDMMDDELREPGGREKFLTRNRKAWLWLHAVALLVLIAWIVVAHISGGH